MFNHEPDDFCARSAGGWRVAKTNNERRATS